MGKKRFIKFLDILCSILPTLFWVLVLFAFEEKFLAIITLLCALIHECGHLICIILIQKGDFTFRSVINGFRIRAHGVRSYDEEIIIYLSGPIANVFAFFICFFMAITINTVFITTAIVNLVTALSNLIPIRGYDGYGAIRAAIKKRGVHDGALKILATVSSALIFTFCVFSLYLIDRYSGGYWIFAVFFVSMIKELKVGLGE